MFIVGYRFSRFNTEQSRHDTNPATAAQSARNSARGQLVCKWHHDAVQKRLACTWHRVERTRQVHAARCSKSHLAMAARQVKWSDQ